MGSQQRRRNASFSITIPSRLLPTVDAAASSFRSRTACLERKIIGAAPLYIENRIDGQSFDGLTRLGRWVRVMLDNRSRIGEAESRLILDRLSSITIKPMATQPRRNQAVDLDSETRTIAVRTLPPIKSRAMANAEASGLSLSAYCLRLLIGQPIYAKPSQDDARIVSELGKIGGLLTLCDIEHASLFSNDHHHRQATQIVADLLSKWRRT